MIEMYHRHKHTQTHSIFMFEHTVSPVGKNKARAVLIHIGHV